MRRQLCTAILSSSLMMMMMGQTLAVRTHAVTSTARIGHQLAGFSNTTHGTALLRPIISHRCGVCVRVWLEVASCWILTFPFRDLKGPSP